MTAHEAQAHLQHASEGLARAAAGTEGYAATEIELARCHVDLAQRFLLRIAEHEWSTPDSLEASGKAWVNP